MSKGRRKMRPEPPWHFHYDTDSCYWCDKHGRGCGGCKILKKYIAEKQRTKRKVQREEKRSLDL